LFSREGCQKKSKKTALVRPSQAFAFETR
jgi:hypothetical protein